MQPALRLPPDDRRRYYRLCNLLRIKQFCQTRGLDPILLGVDLKGSSAGRPEQFEEIENIVRRIVLVKGRDTTKAWKLYELYASQNPHFTEQLVFMPLDEDPSADADDCKGPVLNIYHHPEVAVRRCLKKIFDSKLKILPDVSASLQLGRDVYMRNCSGYNYVFSPDTSALKRPELLRTLLHCHRESSILPLATSNPAMCPKATEPGTFFCLVSGALSASTVRTDEMGKYNGKTDGANPITIKAKTETFSYSLNADGTKLVNIGTDREYQLQMFKGRPPSAPHIQKTVWTLECLADNSKTHLLIWTFTEPEDGRWRFPVAAPHGNSRHIADPYIKADQSLRDEAAKILKDATVSIASAQQLLRRRLGRILSKSTLIHIARVVRGHVGTSSSKVLHTNPSAVKALLHHSNAGFLTRVVEVYHGPNEKSVNLVVVDQRLLRIVASCQPSQSTLQRRKEEIEHYMSSGPLYSKFLSEVQNKAHDDSGYWRTTGGGWGVDTTYGLSDYLVTVVMAELPHIVANRRERKRVWVPVAVFKHKKKDRKTFAQGFSVMTQLMSTEIDGVRKCPAFVLTDKEMALQELLKTPLFKNAVHGNCDFHLLTNFQDSGCKESRKRPHPEDSSAETSSDEEDDENPVVTRRLDRHYRTTSVLFGKSKKLPYYPDEPGKFEPGAVWCRTYEIFLTMVKAEYENGNMVEFDYKYFLKRSRTIYEKHGARFRLYTGRSTMLGTTNPIECFFKRTKQSIGRRGRTVDQLFKDLYGEFTKVFEAIQIAVTEGGSSTSFRLREMPPGRLQLLEPNEADALLRKYGLPSDVLLRNNFARPLPEQMILTVVPKAGRAKFVEDVEMNWTVEPRADGRILLANKANFHERPYFLECTDALIKCHETQCKGHFCYHIAIALALFPDSLNRDSVLEKCLERYFSEDAMIANANRPGDGEKAHVRKFCQGSKYNSVKPIIGSVPDALIEEPHIPHDDTRLSLEATRDIRLDSSLDLHETEGPSAETTGVFKVPSRSHSVVSGSSGHESFDGAATGRRGERERKSKAIFSPIASKSGKRTKKNPSAVGSSRDPKDVPGPSAVKRRGATTRDVRRTPSDAGSQASNDNSFPTLTEIMYHDDAFH